MGLALSGGVAGAETLVAAEKPIILAQGFGGPGRGGIGAGNPEDDKREKLEEEARRKKKQHEQESTPPKVAPGGGGGMPGGRGDGRRDGSDAGDRPAPRDNFGGRGRDRDEQPQERRVAPQFGQPKPPTDDDQPRGNFRRGRDDTPPPPSGDSFGRGRDRDAQPQERRVAPQFGQPKPPMDDDPRGNIRRGRDDTPPPPPSGDSIGRGRDRDAQPPERRVGPAFGQPKPPVEDVKPLPRDNVRRGHDDTPPPPPLGDPKRFGRDGKPDGDARTPPPPLGDQKRFGRDGKPDGDPRAPGFGDKRDGKPDGDHRAGPPKVEPDNGPDTWRKPSPVELGTRRKERQEFSHERLKDIAGQRREHKDESGRTVIEEPGNRRIVRENGRAFIQHDDSERARRGGRDFREERGPRGERHSSYTRPDGAIIINVYGDDGRLLRRSRRGHDGREFVLIDNRRERWGRHRGHAIGGVGFFVDLTPPVVRIPRHEYYVDADSASEDEIYLALSAPPVEDIEADYTLDEIRYSPSLRERMRRVTLSSINFEFGSWELGEDQISRLEVIARAMRKVLRRNPDEMFLIGGHTDAVGSDEDNLSLSDRRAETVARVLTDEFGIPAENLSTQGYGEQYLAVDTPEPERQNRRVEFQRVTPLMARGEK